jgi:hypothetical protein
MKKRRSIPALAFCSALLFAFGGCQTPAPEEPSQEDQLSSTEAIYLETIASLEAQLREEREAHYISESQYKAQLEDLQNRLDRLSSIQKDPEADTLVFTYRLEENNAIITGYSGGATLLTIPSELDGYPVVGIGDRAFEGSEIAAIVLPEGLVSVGWFAFYNCQDLINITLPDSVSTIGYAAFDGSPGVSVVCPSGSYAERYAQSYGLYCITT